MVRGLQAGHRHAFAHRCPETFRVCHEVIDDLAFRHESIGIVSAIVTAW